MRYIFRLSAALLFCASIFWGAMWIYTLGPVHAQTTYNPINQIRWPLITGHGAATMTCQAASPPPANASSYGQMYLNMDTGGSTYICKSPGVWSQQPSASLFGSGAPVATCSMVSNNGALYNNTGASTVYVCNGGIGTWEGPFGAQGAQGPTGPTGPPTVFTGAWSSSTPYTANLGVSFNGNSFVSLVSNTNVTPPSTCTSNATWAPMACAGTVTNSAVAAVNGLVGNQTPNLAAIPAAGSSSTGVPSNNYAILLLGNSTVAGGPGGNWIVGVCNNTGKGQAFDGAWCAQASAYNCNSSSSCVINFKDTSHFQVGGYYSGGSGTFLNGGPYLVTAITPGVSVTMNMDAASISGSFSNMYTDALIKFGTSGGTFNTIFTGGAITEYPSLKTVCVAEEALGKTCIFAPTTSSINDVRNFAASTSSTFPATLTNVNSLLADWSAFRPGSPIILVEENGAQQGHGAGTQYVCPSGVAASSACGGSTAPTITSGAITQNVSSASTVYSIANGTAVVTANNSFSANQWVTLEGFTTGTYFNAQHVQLTAATGTTYSFLFNHGTVTAQPDTTGLAYGPNSITTSSCPSDFWSGAGAPTAILAPDNITPYQFILDSVGSGVQETVNLDAITPSGSACILTVSNINAHGSGIQIMATEATAAIQETQILHQVYEAALSNYRNVTGIPAQSIIYQRTAPIYATTASCYVDQLHQQFCYAETAQILGATASALLKPAHSLNRQRDGIQSIHIPGAPNTTVNTSFPLTSGIRYPSSIDPAFSPELASLIRNENVLSAGGNWNDLEVGVPPYQLGAEDPAFFDTIMLGTPTSLGNAITVSINYPVNSTVAPAYGLFAGFDKLCLVGVTCYSPTTLSVSTQVSPSNINLGVAFNPFLAYMTNHPGQQFQIAVQRPRMADDLYSLPFYLDRSLTQAAFGKIVSTTTGATSTFTISLLLLPPPLNKNADLLTLGVNDIVVVRGVGATKLPATVTCAPGAATGSTQLVCSDTAGTSYATWTNGTILDIYTPRSPDYYGGAMIAGPNPIVTSTTVNTPSVLNGATAHIYNGATFQDDIIGFINTPTAGAANPFMLYTFTHYLPSSTGGFGIDLGGGKVAKMPIVATGSVPTIASATTIAPVQLYSQVSGAVAITTLTVPAGCTTTATVAACTVNLIPTTGSTWTTATGGNIALGSTAVPFKVLTEVYVVANSLWYPSY